MEHAAEAEDVAAAVELLLATRLFGAHVPRGPHADAGASHPRPAGGADRACDPEIGHHGVLLDEEDVLGLDVPMHEPLAVGVAQSVRHFHRDPHRLVEREQLLPEEPVAQRFTGDVRHDVVERAGGLTRVVKRQDVRMGQMRRDLDLAQEPVGPQGSRQLRPQDLHRHGSVVLEILGQQHGRHASAAELALDDVALGDRRLEPLQRVVHRPLCFIPPPQRTA